MMGEWRRWIWGAGEEGESSPVSDKGTYNQVITSDKIEEEKERKGSVGTDRQRERRGEGCQRPSRLY